MVPFSLWCTHPNGMSQKRMRMGTSPKRLWRNRHPKVNPINETNSPNHTILHEPRPNLKPHETNDNNSNALSITKRSLMPSTLQSNFIFKTIINALDITIKLYIKRNVLVKVPKRKLKSLLGMTGNAWPKQRVN